MILAQVIPLRIPIFLLSVLVLLTGLLVTGAPSASATSVLHVPADYSTVQAAVDAASAGDVIKVASGTYMESVEIVGMSDLELRGQGSPVLRGSNAGVGIKIVDSDDIVIQGLVVEKFKTGIVLEGTDNSRIVGVETRLNDNPADVTPAALK